jgi:hypothetical protein
MKNLLFFTAAALLLVESTVAYADPPGLRSHGSSELAEGTFEG